MYRIFIVSLCLFTSNLDAQEDMKVVENQLQAALESIYDLKSDSDKLEASAAFYTEFTQVLYKPDAFDYPFENLPISLLTPPDNSMRIFTWNINLKNGKEKYYGVVMLKQKKNMVDLIKLETSEKEIRSIEQAQLSNRNWYGAVYYDIIPFKRSGKKYYILVGWDGHSRTLNRKVLEVLSISGKKARFGAPVFKSGKKSKKRILFEYSEEATLSIIHDKKNKRIVFDHLAPMGNHIDGDKEFYAPDLTFDAYKYKRGKWLFEDNVEFLRPKTKKDKNFNTPGTRKTF